MVNILNIPELGKLEIVEVYEYYDQPVLYSCKNAMGHFYLVVAADEDDQYLIWICSAVSTERLNCIRSGKVDLHNAFAHPESTHVVQVKVPYNEQTSVKVNFIQADRIPENMLPVPGECLDLGETFPEPKDSEEEIEKYGKREVLNLTLNFDGPFRSEAPVTALSQILGNFQDVINAIGMHRFNLKGINEDIKRKMQMSFLKVGAEGFEIQLASTNTTDFSKSSDCGDAIEKFLNLLAAGSNQEQLKSHLEELQSTVAKEYTAFLKSLSEYVTDAKFKWVSPNPNWGQTVHLSDHQMQKALIVLEKYDEEISQTYRITDTLTGPSSRAKKFQIETTDKPYKEITPSRAIQSPKTTTPQLAAIPGNAYRNIGDFKAAIKDYSKAIDLNPKNAGIYNARGIAYDDISDFDAAIEDYNKSIDLAPENVGVYNNRGVAYRHKGDFEAALADFNKAIAIDPENVGVYSNRGVAYRRKGDFEAALADFNKAIAIDPDLADVYSARGVAYRRKGDFEAALADFNKAIAIDPDLADVYNDRGVAYLNKSDFEAALADFNKAIAIDPENVRAYCNRGKAWLHLKEWQKAKADLMTAKDMGYDIIESFQKDYESVEDFEAKNEMKMPKDIAALLQQN